MTNAQDVNALVAEARALIAEIDEYNAITKREEEDVLRSLIDRLATALTASQEREKAAYARGIADAAGEAEMRAEDWLKTSRSEDNTLELRRIAELCHCEAEQIRARIEALKEPTQ